MHASPAEGDRTPGRPHRPRRGWLGRRSPVRAGPVRDRGGSRELGSRERARRRIRQALTEDPHEPRVEPVRLAQSREVPPRLDTGFLSGVSCFGLIAEDRPRPSGTGRRSGRGSASRRRSHRRDGRAPPARRAPTSRDRPRPGRSPGSITPSMCGPYPHDADGDAPTFVRASRSRGLPPTSGGRLVARRLAAAPWIRGYHARREETCRADPLARAAPGRPDRPVRCSHSGCRLRRGRGRDPITPSPVASSRRRRDAAARLAGRRRQQPRRVALRARLPRPGRAGSRRGSLPDGAGRAGSRRIRRRPRRSAGRGRGCARRRVA